MIPNLTISNLMIDCANAERAQDFYANLTGWEKTVAFDYLGLKTDNGMTILFAATDIPYVPPVWPEEPGEQQKQMHLDFRVDDLPSAVDEAIRLGATKAVNQYGGEHWVTMLDSEGHPFCLSQRQSNSEFELYFQKNGFSMIPNPEINIDCEKMEILRHFYAQLTGWDQNFHSTALIAENGLLVHFMECDFDFVPPEWPEKPGKQQKQMHFDFQVNNLQSAVEEAINLGATKPARQYGGKQWVTLIDLEGHPFCLCGS